MKASIHCYGNYETQDTLNPYCTLLPDTSSSWDGKWESHLDSAGGFGKSLSKTQIYTFPWGSLSGSHTQAYSC